MTDKLWANFLDWLYRTHSITKDWKPNRTSIELWEEYVKAKQGEKTGEASPKGSKNKKE